MADLSFPPGHHQYLLPLPIESSWESPTVNVGGSEDYLIRAIFIGAFNETKGWDQVKPLVEKNKSIHFLLISKYADDESGFTSDIGSNWEVKRNLGTIELIREVDNSDFLILGSPFETQCLVAIECALRDVPVLMRPTGLLATLPSEDRERVGIFTTNLDEGFSQMIQMLVNHPDFFNPREIIKKYALDNVGLRKEWIDILVGELQQSFIPPVPVTFYNKVKTRIPKRIKSFIRKIF